MSAELMTVGEVARRMGVSVRTLQHYDREGVLTPSSHSEGGRRQYTPKDLVKLHQILSFKYLGFSLEQIKNRILPMDTPGQVAAILVEQQKIVAEEIGQLQDVLDAVTKLEQEVRATETVDFLQYAKIIELLRVGSNEYWIWKSLDSGLVDHIHHKLSDDPQTAYGILNTYQKLLDEAVSLKQDGTLPDEPKALALAGGWYEMIQAFSGGDPGVLQQLLARNEDKSGWDVEVARKQADVDDFIGDALEHYVQLNHIDLPL